MIKLFDREEGIGLSFIRQPMGASDFARDFYTYNDMPKGQTDETLHNPFQLIMTVLISYLYLQEALSINPDIEGYGQSLECSRMDEDHRCFVGGQLKPQYYPVYGEYFAKFIQAYKEEGIDIFAITPQNEPLYVPVHYSGLGMNANQQTNLLKMDLFLLLKSGHRN
jgi:glucosylceramidase